MLDLNNLENLIFRKRIPDVNLYFIFTPIFEHQIEINL